MKSIATLNFTRDGDFYDLDGSLGSIYLCVGHTNRILDCRNRRRFLTIEVFTRPVKGSIRVEPTKFGAFRHGRFDIGKLESVYLATGAQNLFARLCAPTSAKALYIRVKRA